MTLPTSATERKDIPLCTGCLDYFPDALCAVAAVSLQGSRQHHPDKPLHWDRAKSTDEADALLRHLIERGTLDTDGHRHSAKAAWRALALLQKEIENDQAGIHAVRPASGNDAAVDARDHGADGQQRAFLASGGAYLDVSDAGIPRG
jgi:hypothetical protein